MAIFGVHIIRALLVERELRMIMYNSDITGCRLCILICREIGERREREGGLTFTSLRRERIQQVYDGEILHSRGVLVEFYHEMAVDNLRLVFVFNFQEAMVVPR